MRTLIAIALVIGATSADAALQVSPTAPEKSLAVAQHIVAVPAPVSCQLQQQLTPSSECSVAEPTVVASAPPRRPRAKTRRR